MRKLKLVKGTTKKAIAMASAFMMTFGTAAGNVSVISAYAETTAIAVDTENSDSTGDVTAGVTEGTSGAEETGGAGETGDNGEAGGTGEAGETGDNGESGETDGNGEAGESGDNSEAGENGGNEESGESGENGETGETGENGETGETEENGETGETGKTDESGGTGENEDAGTTEETDESKEAGENNGAEESEGTGTADDLEKPDENKAADKEVSNTEKQPEITDETQQNTISPAELQQKAVTLTEITDNGFWYILFDSIIHEGDYYYLINESGEKGEKITKQYIETQAAEQGSIIRYVDGEGNVVKKKWLEEGDSFRYANGDGEILFNAPSQVTGGFFGDFDEYGYWTPADTGFHKTKLKKEVFIIQYVGKGGRIEGIGGAEGKKHTQQYCFKEEAGVKTCYLLDEERKTILDGTPIANTWIEDLRTDDLGHVITGVKKKEIDGKYYDFDEEGRSTLITNTFIGEGEDKIYVGEDGAQVKGEFVSYEEYVIYIDTNGKQAFRKWIETDGKFRYVNSKGHMIINDDKEAGGFYGRFDSEGYWSPIEHEFFESSVGETRVNKYSGDAGRICGTGGEGDKRHTSLYCFTIDNWDCYLVPGDAESLSDELKVRSIWIDDLYVNEIGSLTVSEECLEIEDQFYKFDVEGHSSLIVNQFVTGADGKEYYVGSDGAKVFNELVTYDSNKYYIGENGQKVISSLILADGQRYYFEADGKMAVSKFVTFDGALYYVDAEGKVVTNQFATVGEDTFYFGADGKKVVSSLVTDETGTYYVGTDGKKLTSQIVRVDSDDYYVDETGKVVTSRFAEVGDDVFYFGADGKKALNQFVTDETGTYYVGADGKKLTDQFVIVGTDTYYVDAEGKRVTGRFAAYDGKTFYFGDDGKKVTDSFVTDETGTYYVGTDGQKVMNQFVSDETGSYYMGTDGKMTFSQFVTVGPDTYYVGADGRMATNQFATYGGDTFYFGADGKKAVNQFVTDSTGTYYVGADGTIVTDELITVGPDTYYVDADGKKVISRFVEVGEDTFYFDADGKKAFNRLVTDSTGTYYVGADGRKVTSQFVTDGTDTYCAGEDGRMVTNQFATYGEDTFYFGSDGKKAVSRFVTEGPDTYYVGADGKKVTNQFATYGNDTFYFGADGKKVTNQFVSDSTGTYYVGSDGRKAISRFVSDGVHTFYMAEDGKMAVRRWLNDERGFRYVNGKGYMQVNTIKVAGGFYGRFDAEGYWTDISNTFFKDELSDGTIVTKYSGAEGKVAGIGEKVDGRKYFCFEEKAGGTYCYLIGSDETPADGVQAANVWISDMWVNAGGYLVKNSDVPVDGVYYHFDKDGHGTLINYRISYVLNGGTNSGNPSGYNGAMDTIVLGEAKRPGYRFDGWYTDSGFTSRVTEIPARSYGDMTIYAKWEAIYVDSGSDDSDDSDDSYSGSGSSSGSSTNTNTGANANTNTNTNTNTNANTNAGSASPVSVSVGADQSVTVQHGEVTVSADLTLTSAGSLNNNTIVSVKETAEVTLAEGQKAEIATIAVGADGSTRSLLASQVQGATVQQTTITVQGVAVTQNAVVYADGTKVAQKSGAVELEGFAETVISTEQAIQSGAQTIAAAYNDKVEIDLNQYQQVGAAVAYEVVPGVNGTVPQTQVEQTSFTPGQEVKALITDAAGNVTAVTVVVGDKGVVQYPIPGVNCIVRFMVPKTE